MDSKFWFRIWNTLPKKEKAPCKPKECKKAVPDKIIGTTQALHKKLADVAYFGWKLFDIQNFWWKIFDI